MRTKQSTSSKIVSGLIVRIVILLFLVPVVYLGIKVFVSHKEYEVSSDFDLGPFEYSALFLEPDSGLLDSFFDIEIGVETSAESLATVVVLEQEAYEKFEVDPVIESVLILSPGLTQQNIRDSWTSGWVTVSKELESFVVVVYNQSGSSTLSGKLGVKYRYTRK
jgi:hypothetical protein